MRLTILSVVATLLLSLSVSGCCGCRNKRPKKDDDESTTSISVRPT